MKYVGQSVARLDARAKVRGAAVFASDMVMENQAYMKVLLARRPHAIVRSLALRKARAVAGGMRAGIVLGADTIVVLSGRILGKPVSPAASSSTFQTARKPRNITCV